MMPSRDGADSASKRALPNELDAQVEALSRALRQRLRERAGLSGEASAAPAEMRALLRLELRNLCAMARDSGIPPEALIIRLKSTWNNVPSIRYRAPADAQLAEMITACIEEYYG